MCQFVISRGGSPYEEMDVVATIVDVSCCGRAWGYAATVGLENTGDALPAELVLVSDPCLGLFGEQNCTIRLRKDGWCFQISCAILDRCDGVALGQMVVASPTSLKLGHFELYRPSLEPV
ncbi:MAG: hypothetical protein HW380_470 [Magnetococcales bacterium]|nr:hypothetical protein [Magnetococcales bacterium]